MLTHNGGIPRKKGDTAQIYPLNGRSERYLEDFARLGKTDVSGKNMQGKQRNHLAPWCKSRILTPRGFHEVDDIVFTKADANQVHHPHENALVIMVEITNSLVH